ncbi:DUF2855 domain-containing protein [Durusdinium trenchii]|uniref:DUF2855 domain-containing protein n=1 Tax=Durusdinium trenchii TaxID=1381693 RepID=A0ABP0LL75_9DINO
MTTISEFQVKKDDLNQVRLTTRETDAIGEGEILVKVDRFAFTANNVTYGVVGERIGYWKFFPVAENGWGIIPVWGFADVIESNCAEIPVGERLYGYWPMASHLVMRPAKVSDARLFDGADHRAELPPVYNSYARVNAEPAYDAAMDDERMALFPLYATSFCLYDFLKDNDWFSAEQVIIPSASSKTAIGTAYAIKSDDAPPRLVGFTSPRNKAAVEALGLYDTVLTYDDDAVDTATPAVIVDMSGNGEVLGRLHKALGDNMKYTSNVGVTHYDANSMGPDFIRERSAMFFAPGHIQKRTKEWGPGEFEKRAFAFWHEAAIKSRSWLAIQKELGADAVERAYRDVLDGKAPADMAWVVGF